MTGLFQHMHADADSGIVAHLRKLRNRRGPELQHSCAGVNVARCVLRCMLVVRCMQQDTSHGVRLSMSKGKGGTLHQAHTWLLELESLEHKPIHKIEAGFLCRGQCEQPTAAAGGRSD